MQVSVDSSQIEQMEKSLESQMMILRAITVKFGDGKGTLRISQADMNKSEDYTFTSKQLKQGVKFQVKKKED
jgi:hypothetical protein